MSYAVGRTGGWDLALLWLWCRLAAVAVIGLLAWEPPYAIPSALKSKKKKIIEVCKTHTFSSFMLNIDTKQHYCHQHKLGWVTSLFHMFLFQCVSYLASFYSAFLSFFFFFFICDWNVFHVYFQWVKCGPLHNHPYPWIIALLIFRKQKIAYCFIITQWCPPKHEDYARTFAASLVQGREWGWKQEGG